MSAHTTGDEPTRVPLRLAHQPGLDGLRGLAVLTVVVYHLSVGPQSGPMAGTLTGGFLGVDLFFVLSGFLITSLLLIDHAHRGRTTSWRFWERRIRRLLPALLVTILIGAAFAAIVVPPWELAKTRGMGVASLLYVSNWYTAFGGFTANPLGHTWSLSIEEQWYLLWPFLLGALLVLARGRRPLVAIITGALAAASFVAMAVLFAEYGWERPYYGTDTRASELLAGAVLAMALLGRGAPKERRVRLAIEGAGILGLVTIAWLTVVATPFDPWMYNWGFLVVTLAGVAVVTAAVQAESYLLRPMLSWRPLTAIGLISYGLYLYHVLVIKWIVPAEVGLDGWPLVFLRVVVMFGAAVLSYHFIEMPVRRGAITQRQARFGLPIILAGVVLTLVLTTTGGYPIPESELRAQYYQQVAASTPLGTERVLMVGEGEVYDVSRAGVHRGDHIRGLAVPLLFCEIAAGQVVVGTLVAEPRVCPNWKHLFGAAVAHYRPDTTVLLAGRQAVFDRRVGTETLRVGTDALAESLRGSLDRAHDVLTVDGAPMVLLDAGCVPMTPSEGAGILAIKQDPARRAWVQSIWQAFAAAHPRTVTLVDASPVLCESGSGSAGTASLRTSSGRLSPAGIRALWTWLATVVDPAGEAQA